jgi:hypothetical protein
MLGEEIAIESVVALHEKCAGATVAALRDVVGVAWENGSCDTGHCRFDPSMERAAGWRCRWRQCGRIRADFSQTVARTTRDSALISAILPEDRAVPWEMSALSRVFVS